VNLPTLPQILARPTATRLLSLYDQDNVLQGCRDILDELRRAVSAGQAIDPAGIEPDAILGRLEARLGATEAPGLQRVVNASGIILHSGLGGALLPHVATEAMLLAATQAVDFEYDLAHADHSPAEQMAEELLVSLTGAEAAAVVTNHVAAVLLVGSTLPDSTPQEHLPIASFVDLSVYGLPKAPLVAERVAAIGPGVVTFSGDLLVGGPEAGFLLGPAALIDEVRRSDPYQAARCTKVTIAALEATLRLYRESACIAQDIPALKTLTRSMASIEETAQRALPSLASALGWGFRVTLQDATSRIGDGALSRLEIPTKILVVDHDFMGAHRIAMRFRQARPPIIGRIKDDWFVLDARTIFDPLDLVPNWTEGFDGPSPILP
jgi:seryl-tRNA(Sec) selenium transferase